MLANRFQTLLFLINKSDPTGFVAFRRNSIYINNDNEVLTLEVYGKKDYMNFSRKTADIPDTIKKEISTKTAIKLGLLL
jgi:hypothetical protein